MCIITCAKFSGRAPGKLSSAIAMTEFWSKVPSSPLMSSDTQARAFARGPVPRAGTPGRDRLNGPVRALPDPFARDPEVSSDLCQGLRSAPGQSEASFQHPAVALVRNRRHRRGHQPPHALARPCQNLPEIPGIRQIGQPWHGALRRPVIEQQTAMRLVRTASAFPENVGGELHQVAERRTGEEPGPPLAVVDPLPDVEHLADVRCRG